MDKWTDWPLKLHTEEEQIKRIEESFNVDLYDIETISQAATAENGYNVSLTKCTCMDFNTRKLPCKHIYRLAYILEKLKLPRIAKREPILIADFTSGFAKGWHFAVGMCFMNNLDIKLKKPAKGQPQEGILTQGYNFTFEVGQMFYDNPDVYNHIWSEAIQEINHAIQIHSVYPNRRSYSFTYKDGILDGQVAFKYGAVVFDLFRVNNDGDKLLKIGRHSLSADEFVRFLKEGVAQMPDGETLNIFEL